jgi:hypothetical protein
MARSAIDNVSVDFTLPLKEIPNTLMQLVSELPSPPPLHGPQSAVVLIVEDERIVAKNLERLLKNGIHNLWTRLERGGGGSVR